MTAQERQRRWYDQDPLVSMAMETLENSDDEEQIRLALHLIKIITEHNLEDPDGSPGEEFRKEVQQRMAGIGNARWYDMDRNLKTSIEMLRMCPVDTQRLIARDMASQIKKTLEADENADGG